MDVTVTMTREEAEAAGGAIAAMIGHAIERRGMAVVDIITLRNAYASIARAIADADGSDLAAGQVQALIGRMDERAEQAIKAAKR